MIKISGRVIKGEGYGRKLGFPTVNLETANTAVKPLEGVYAGNATLEGKIYKAGIVLGPHGKIEAHLLNYSGDAYGKVVLLTLHKFLRKFKKFDTETALIEQIKKDLTQIQ